MSSPWDINYFDPPKPHITAPSPRRMTPRLVPEADRLFQVQRNTLKVLNDLRDLAGQRHEDHRVADSLRALQRDAENAYRVIRSYLKDFVADA